MHIQFLRQVSRFYIKTTMSEAGKSVHFLKALRLPRPVGFIFNPQVYRGNYRSPLEEIHYVRAAFT